MRAGAEAETHILGVADFGEVLNVDAGAIAAGMVNLEPLANRPKVVLERVAVRGYHSAIDPELPIAVDFRPRPQHALAGGPCLGGEPVDGVRGWGNQVRWHRGSYTIKGLSYLQRFYLRSAA